jgi:hypothetical protein
MPDESILTAGDTSTDVGGEGKPAKGTPPAGAPTAESKPAEGASAADATKKGEGDGKPVVPEKYELKLPENAVLEAADVEDTAALAKELGLSNEAAQKLLEKRDADRASLLEGQQKFLRDAVASWENAVKADPEIIGEKGTDFKANVTLAKQALNRFGSPDLIKALKETGYGSHPELVRMMVRIGKAMRDDVMHEGKNLGGDKNRDPAEKFYPQTK